MRSSRTSPGRWDQPDGESGSHWDSLVAQWLDGPRQLRWRSHSDAVNAALVDRWLPGGCERVLKTDLFDEAVSGGLYPLLAERAESVVGIDVSPGIVAAASSRHGALEAHCAD